MTARDAILTQDRLGLLVMALSVVMFTALDTSAKWLILAGLAPLQVVFARYAFHLLIALIWFVPLEGTRALRSSDPKLQLLRSAFLLGATILNFYAIRALPLTTVMTIFFTGPMLTTLLAIPLLGERVDLRQILASVAGFCGVLIIVQPWGAQIQLEMLFALAGMAMASGYFLLTRKMAAREANSTAQIWSSTLGALILAPLIVAEWVWPQGALQWAIFVAVGGFGFAAHVLATSAHRLSAASLLAPVLYVQIVFASLAEALIFDTLPTAPTLAGGAVIILSGVYIWRHNGRETRPSPTHLRGTR